MKSWRKYQEETAEIFIKLGCKAGVNQEVEGVRNKHSIDVWVEFEKFGLETNWIVECKHWKRRVSQDMVHTLRDIVQDIGADKGILVSKSGFQSGAVAAARKSNIILTDLIELRNNASEDLKSFVFHKIRSEILRLFQDFSKLKIRESTGEMLFTVKPLDGVDGTAVRQAEGNLLMILKGLDLALTEEGYFFTGFDSSGNNPVFVSNLDDFIKKASEVINSGKDTMQKEKGKLRKKSAEF